MFSTSVSVLIYVVASINASWHVYLMHLMSELFCDNLNKQDVDLNLSEDLWSLNALIAL